MSIQRRPKTGKPAKGQPVKWIVRYRDPSGKEHSKTFSTATHDAPEKAAKAFDADQATKLARGTWIDPADEKTTLGQIVDEWVELSRTDGTRGVRSGFRSNLGDLADMPIGRIRAGHITAWIKDQRDGRPWKAGRPLADITIKMNLSKLKSIFDHAVEDQLIARSPITSTLARQAVWGMKVEKRKVPTFDEVKLLCRTAEKGGDIPVESTVSGRKKLRPSPWLAMAIRLGVDTGLRVGELAGLQWRDVDLTAGTLTVRRQCINAAGKTSPLKTANSVRTVPLSSAMVAELSAVVRGPGDPVVPGARGRGSSSQDMTRHMRLLAAVSGVDRARAKFHGLRHLYASSMLQAGEPITTVAALLGDTVPTVGAVYAHWLPGAQDAARASVEALAGSVRDDGPVLRVVDGGRSRSAG